MKKTIHSPAFRAIYRAQDGKCFYCNKRMLSMDGRSDDLTIDHFMPLALGGRSHISNYVLACLACNTDKADRLPNAKEKSKKFFMNRYIKYNKAFIFKMKFREKVSLFEVKKLSHGCSNKVVEIQAQQK